MNNTPVNAPPFAGGCGGDNDELEEFSDEFKCCVCLDLIYKPVVLACGHISCFWCVFEAMDTWQESRCPVCRHAYYHFPSICWLLHFVLLKLYPAAYKSRENQVIEEEKIKGTFSPQFENHLAVSHCNEQMPLKCHANGKGEDCSVRGSLEPSLPDNNCTTGNPTSSSDKITENVTIEGNRLSGNNCVDRPPAKQVPITDLLCAICKILLFRPVVLNCGHVFCETCIVDSCNEPCRCPVCRSMHPNGFPKVCLVLEGFLEQHVSEEYAARRVAIDSSGQGSSSTVSTQAPQGSQRSSVSMNDIMCSPDSKVHFGVGCDSCGMYPLIGDRYRCKDCLEEIGFDLCEDCYKSSSNLPGRFNQQHKPDHEFEIMEPNSIIILPSEDHAPRNPQNPTIASEWFDPEPDPTNHRFGDRDTIRPRNPQNPTLASRASEWFDPEPDLTNHGFGDRDTIGPRNPQNRTNIFRAYELFHPVPNPMNHRFSDRDTIGPRNPQNRTDVSRASEWFDPEPDPTNHRFGDRDTIGPRNPQNWTNVIGPRNPQNRTNVSRASEWFDPDPEPDPTNHRLGDPGTIGPRYPQNRTNVSRASEWFDPDPEPDPTNHRFGDPGTIGPRYPQNRTNVSRASEWFDPEPDSTNDRLGDRDGIRPRNPQNRTNVSRASEWHGPEPDPTNDTFRDRPT